LTSPASTSLSILALAVIALMAYALATYAGPAGPSTALTAAAVLFLFASGAYAVGLLQGILCKKKVSPDKA
jgi:cellobiose-specific phosphotransferase system component IIC